MEKGSTVEGSTGEDMKEEAFHIALGGGPADFHLAEIYNEKVFRAVGELPPGMCDWD